MLLITTLESQNFVVDCSSYQKVITDKTFSHCVLFFCFYCESHAAVNIQLLHNIKI